MTHGTTTAPPWTEVTAWQRLLPTCSFVGRPLDRGVDTVFGGPGAGSNGLMNALPRLCDGLLPRRSRASRLPRAPRLPLGAQASALNGGTQRLRAMNATTQG